MAESQAKVNEKLPSWSVKKIPRIKCYPTTRAPEARSFLGTNLGRQERRKKGLHAKEFSSGERENIISRSIRNRKNIKFPEDPFRIQ